MVNQAVTTSCAGSWERADQALADLRDERAKGEVHLGQLREGAVQVDQITDRSRNRGRFPTQLSETETGVRRTIVEPQRTLWETDAQ
jgi:hypothetical protein